MKHKLVLAVVNSKKALYSTTAEGFAAIAPNIQMGLLAAYARSKNIEVKVIDAEIKQLTIDQLIDELDKENPLLTGFICCGSNPSSSTMTMAGIVDFFKRFHERKVDVKTFIWGPHPTVLPERSLKETGADFIIRGEGYNTIVQLFRAIENLSDLSTIPSLTYKVVSNGKEVIIHTELDNLIEDLDTLPMIDWEEINPVNYIAHNWHAFGDINKRAPYAIIWTSFGCPFNCSYCCINNLFGKRTQRFRSVDKVIEEISMLVERYNVKHLKVLDELFVTHPKRIKEFCSKLEKKGYDLNMWSYARVDTIDEELLKKLKGIGMNWLSYGFETASSKTLKEIKKGEKATLDRAEEVIKMTKDTGINICADVMFGLWDDDSASMENTYDFLVKHNFEWGNMYPLFAYPGTALYDEIEEPESWKVYSLYGYECIPRGTKYCTPAEVLKFRDDAFQRYHGRPEYLSMIESKFGNETKEHIVSMLKKPLKRRLLEEC